MPKPPRALGMLPTLGSFAKCPLPFRGTRPLRRASTPSQRLALEACPQHHMEAFSACSLQTPTDSLFCQKMASSRKAAWLSPALSEDLTIIHTSCPAARVAPTPGGVRKASRG